MSNCKYCGKECKRLVVHERRCLNNPNRIVPSRGCKFCGKYFPVMSSLTNHERFCKLNPNMEISTLNKLKYGSINNPRREGWNKGLTADTDSRVAAGKETRARHFKEGLFVAFKCSHTSETKLKLSKIAKENHLGGTTHKKIHRYKDTNIYFDSSYESILAENLDNNKVIWTRCSRFPWHDENNDLHHYTPDFYLPHYDIYLDPKNDYLITKDTFKINQVMKENNIKVLILDKNNLSWDKIKQLL